MKGDIMSLQAKYSPVLALANELKIQGLEVKEEAGKLKLSGTVNTQYEKNIIWDKIKEVGGERYSDLSADIKVANTDYYHLHIVESGESLSKIAKQYYKDANSYMKIFEANKDQLTNPDMIKVGQKLKIPKP
jgi:nucleoid-associated protein YgaU